MDFGKRVAYIREREGLLQKELADMTGVTARNISDCERGISIPRDEIKIRIAKALNISMDYLMGLNDDIVSYDDKDCIVLPKGFSQASKKKVIEYIDLLMVQQKSKK